MLKNKKASRKEKNKTPNKMKAGILLGIPLFLLLAGISIIGFAGFNLFKQTYLISSIIVNKPVEAVTSSKFVVGNNTFQYPKLGSDLGKVVISSISLNYPLIHGDDDDALERGIGHYAGSTLPGENGNVVIAGHRDTVFRNLGKVKIGDIITLETYYGTYKYKASKIRIVDKNDLTVVVPKDKETLTIYTCYPFEYIGHAPQRYVIEGEFVEGTSLKELKIQNGKWLNYEDN